MCPRIENRIKELERESGCSMKVPPGGGGSRDGVGDCGGVKGGGSYRD